MGGSSAVELGDDELVTLKHPFQRGFKLTSLRTHGGHLLLEDLATACATEIPKLSLPALPSDPM